MPTRISFVDIAGLVRGASKGEGLGNQFLANIREVDAIVHVLRCFEDGDVTHVEGRVDPVSDAETVNTELMLADLASLERRVSPLRKRAQTGDKEAKAEVALMDAALAELNAGQAGADGARSRRARKRRSGRSTSSPPSRCSTSPMSTRPRPRPATPLSAKVEAMAKAEGAGCVVISAAIEAEIAQLPDDEQHEFLASLGLEEPGLDRLIRAGYALLGLVTYFTAGPKEARAWTIHDGHARAAGGRRHPHRLREGLHPRPDHRL